MLRIYHREGMELRTSSLDEQNCRYPQILVHIHLLPRTAIAVGERENVTFGVCSFGSLRSQSQKIARGGGGSGRLIDILPSFPPSRYRLSPAMPHNDTQRG